LVTSTVTSASAGDLESVTCVGLDFAFSGKSEMQRAPS